MRAVFLVAMLLAVSLVPLVEAEETVRIAAPRAGSVATYHVTYGTPDQVFSAWNVTDEWSALEMTHDGFGLERPSYVVTRDQGCGHDYPCTPIEYRIDPATRLAFELSGRGGLILTDGQNRIGPFMSERYTDSTYDMHIFATVPMLDWLGHGMTLVTGDIHAVPIPPSPMYPTGPGEATLRALGWEDVEGQRLFRIEAHALMPQVGEWSMTLWYDGTLPVPTRTWEDLSFTTCGADGCTLHERHLTGSLTRFTLGSDPLIAPAVEEPDRRDDAIRVPLGPDGPADLEHAAFPRDEALAAIRSHPDAATWFAAHPDAYVVRGHASEGTSQSPRSTWWLTWADGHEVLTTKVARPHVAGVAVPVPIETTVTNRSMTRPYPAFEELPTHTIACIEQARKDLRERLGAVDAERPAEDVSWRVSSRPPHVPTCHVTEYAPTASYDVEKHPPGGRAFTERRHALAVAIATDTGGLRYTAEGRPGSVDRAWIEGVPLP